MELEEMKSLWEQMTIKIEKQERLTDQLIMEMTKERYHKKFRKISTYESIGAVICFIGAAVLLLNINKMDSWYMMLSDIFTIAILIILPILSLKSIRGIQRINIGENNLKETLMEYGIKKQRFLFIQRISIALSFVLMVTALPVMSKIMSGKDIFTESNVLYWYVPIGMVILFFFARWVFKYYQNIAKSAEKILEEIE
jgi:hypothetical protein